jgi:predicted phage tail protein
MGGWLAVVIDTLIIASRSFVLALRLAPIVASRRVEHRCQFLHGRQMGLYGVLKLLAESLWQADGTSSQNARYRCARH